MSTTCSHYQAEKRLHLYEKRFGIKPPRLPQAGHAECAAVGCGEPGALI